MQNLSEKSLLRFVEKYRMNDHLPGLESFTIFCGTLARENLYMSTCLRDVALRALRGSRVQTPRAGGRRTGGDAALRCAALRCVFETSGSGG